MKTSLRRDVLWLAAIAAASAAVQLPFLDRGLSLLDEGSPLAIAEGLRRGGVLYRDHNTFVAPLVYELLRVLLALFGDHLLVGRLFQALVFTLCALLLYGVARAFAGPRGAGLVALSLLPIKAIGFPLWTIPNYSQLAMLLALASLAASLRYLLTGRARWLVAAGVAAGLTLLAKQTLGVAIAAAAGVALLASAALAREAHPLRALAARAGLLAAAALVPVALALGFYAAQGALDDLVERAVLAPFAIGDDIAVGLPPLAPWPESGRGDRLFVYAPVPVVSLSFATEGGLSLDSPPLAPLLEWGVKALYYGPLIAAVALAVALARDLSAGADGRRRAARLLPIVTFALAAYASTLYRADFAHLMHVAPPLIALCGAGLMRLWGGAAAARALVGALVAGWWIAGCLTAACAFAAFDTPLETPRGRLRVLPEEAETASAVLAYVGRQPADARVVFLRGEPLYYFLTGRPAMGFDLVLPGFLRPGDDERVASELLRADSVIYNPRGLGTLPRPFPEYAPLSARVLARGFRFDEKLSNSAFPLVRLPGRPQPDVLDIADPAVALESTQGPAFERVPWLFYRVLAVELAPGEKLACFSVGHRVRSGDTLRSLAIHHPKLWTGVLPDVPSAYDAVFEIRAHLVGGVSHKLRATRYIATTPRAPRVIRLDPFAGQRVKLEFCVRRLPELEDDETWLNAGWAEPHVTPALSRGPRARRRE